MLVGTPTLAWGQQHWRGGTNIGMRKSEWQKSDLVGGDTNIGVGAPTLAWGQQHWHGEKRVAKVRPYLCREGHTQIILKDNKNAPTI